MSIEELMLHRKQESENWQLSKKAEREEISQMRDSGIMLVTTDPESYLAYLDMQAKNPNQTPGNVILVQTQTSGGEGTFHTADEWKELGRYVVQSERPKGVKIFKRNKRTGFYDPESAYDLSQTSGRPLVLPPRLTEGAQEMQAAIDALLRRAQKLKVPTPIERNMDVPALYDERYISLPVNPDTPESAVFAALAKELTLAQYHDRGYNPDYSREDFEFDADSTAYLVCTRYGVPCAPPKIELLSSYYPEQFDARGREAALRGMQDAARQMTRSIDYATMSRAPEQSKRSDPGGRLHRPLPERFPTGYRAL